MPRKATKRLSSVPVKIKDAESTRARLVEAVGTLLARRGFAALGVNAVAKEAGVDQVLIYGYVGGMPELLRAFGESADFWPTFEEMAGDEPAALAARRPSEITSALLVNFARALRRRPMTQEIMAWETVKQNELTEVLKEVREDRAEKLFREFGAGADGAGVDAGAVTTLLAAAVSYLVIRSRDTKVFNTVDIRSDEGWKRLERSVVDICERCFVPRRSRTRVRSLSRSPH
jgi:AcrR family transcriptional regulator